MLGPIFGRECLTLPRRSRHYVQRSMYLGALWVLILTVWQVVVGWEISATLGDNARFGRLAFQVLALVQLTLVMFFAALSAASAVALEKDRRTFILLLITDLRNYEIVLGKLLGSLLQLAILLAGMIPVLALLLLLGGIAVHHIVEVVVILAATGLAAGSLGSLVALWRDRTFQSLALTVLLLVLYLVVVQALRLLPSVTEETWAEDWFPAASVDAWQARLQPFIALQQALDTPLVAPSWPIAYQFALTMAALAFGINGLALWKLRVWNPSGEPIMQREAANAEAVDRAKAHAAPGRVRKVWDHPVLWREIATRAYGRRPLLIKAAYFLVLGLVVYYAFLAPSDGAFAAARGLVPVCVLSLLLVNAQAVTAITSERDVGALDLLLATELSAKEFVFSKFLGVLYNTKEYLLPPLILAGIYAWRGQLASAPPGHPELLAGKNLDAFLCILLGGLVLFAFTIMLGLHVALRTENSRAAVINSLGTIFFLSVGTLVCIYLILINGRFEYQWLSFSAFLFAGVAGLWWVLSGDKPSAALTVASWVCPLAVFYSVTNVIIGKPGLRESADPLYPFAVTALAFGFTLVAMLIPLLSEFDVALGRASATGE
jgi:ABC-type transport system involved in multi-copper enzyme maturation permease subunit